LATNRSARRSRLEAVLFLAREPLTLRKLAQSANLADATEARTLLAELRRVYDARTAAFQVEQLAGGYQLRTRPKFAPWLRPLVRPGEQIRLTQPALETLAVVAYRQPVLRADVEAIRGVACGEILRQLMDRDLLRIVGRSEELGRPLWYGTTRRFLEVFGLCSLDELPLAAQLRRGAQRESGDKSKADETTVEGTERMDAA
jgi:segregation and condensation protein B